VKIFLAYAFTGEDVNVVTARMKMAVNTLNTHGHEAYCNMFDPAARESQQQNDVKVIFQKAFDAINRNEAVVAIFTSPSKSVGQIMEIGVAISKGKPVYLFEHTSAKGSTYLQKVAVKTYEWATESELEAMPARI
jgi:nucleoside 2-deoxyribosyltransferase